MLKDMRTRREVYHLQVRDVCAERGLIINNKIKQKSFTGERMSYRKKSKISPEFVAGGNDLFDYLPDDLVLCILSKLSSSAICPSDFISVLIT